MHSGKITNRTMEARVLAELERTPGQWWSNWALAQAVRTPCVATYLSSIRKQLPPGVLEHKTEGRDGTRGHFYRIVQVHPPDVPYNSPDEYALGMAWQAEKRRSVENVR